VIKSGAQDYVAKPIIPDEILHSIKKGVNVSSTVKSEEPVRVKKKYKPTVKNYCRTSPEQTELYKQIDLVAPTNYSVIIYGEAEPGKKLLREQFITEASVVVSLSLRLTAVLFRENLQAANYRHEKALSPELLVPRRDILKWQTRYVIFG